jgi:NCAIR mutase (PurE)-related protein
VDAEKLRRLLSEVEAGDVSVDDALGRLRNLPFEDLGYAQLDLHRAIRQGMPEVVFCQGKTNEHAAGIFERLWANHDRVLGTRASPDMAAFIQARLPEARYDPLSRLVMLARGALPEPASDAAYALVACAGTADLPVAEEASQTLTFYGGRVVRAYDVGVAGLHRLLNRQEDVANASVIISVAGMEGALTSVIGGLAACPVIGVPTSVGYGASFGGLAALLAMLNSCASGVSVVNIDNGFGAAVVAYRILALAGRGSISSTHP